MSVKKILDLNGLQTYTSDLKNYIAENYIKNDEQITNVSFEQILKTGLKLGTITINGVSTDLYCYENNEINPLIFQINGIDVDTFDGSESKTFNITKSDLGVIDYSNASQTTDGLMSSSDKYKLDGISENATSVSFVPTISEGIEIGTLTIDGNENKLYYNDDGFDFKVLSDNAIDDIFLEDGYVLPDQMYLMNTITEDELVDAFNGIIPPDYPLNEKADTIKESEIQELFS